MQLDQLRRREFITLLGGARNVAARGARAAADEAADHRVLGYNHAFSHGRMGCRFRAATARTRLDRRSQYCNRVSVGRGAQRTLRRDRSRVSAVQGRCHRDDCACLPCSPAGDIGYPNCVCTITSRPSSRWLRRELGTTRRERTGLSMLSPDTAGKRLELLREVVPGIRRLAVMVNLGFPGAVQEGSEAHAAASALGLEVVKLEIRRPQDIASSFESLKADALYVTGDALFNANRICINTFALSARLPTIYPFREHVEAGGLMSYGANLPDLFRRAAGYVDRILRGAKPADLPVEQPIKFDLIINLTTAKALGLTVPESFLVRADEVIE